SVHARPGLYRLEIDHGEELVPALMSEPFSRRPPFRRAVREGSDAFRYFGFPGVLFMGIGLPGRQRMQVLAEKGIDGLVGRRAETVRRGRQRRAVAALAARHAL